MIDNEAFNYTSKDATTIYLTDTNHRGIWTDATYTTQVNSHLSDSTVWVHAPSATTKGVISGVSSTPITRSTTLTPVSDLSSNGADYDTAQVKIVINDGSLANQIGYVNLNVTSG